MHPISSSLLPTSSHPVCRYVSSSTRSTLTTRTYSPAAIALPPPIQPLPFFSTLVITAASLLLSNARILTESLLSRHLRTRTTINQLHLGLFQTHISEIKLLDTASKPLLSIPKLNIQFALSGFFSGSFSLSAPNAELFVDIEGRDFSQTNWSRHIALLRSRTNSQAPTTLQTSKFQTPLKSLSKPESPISWEASVSVTEGIIVGISRGQFELPKISLPGLRLSTREVENISAAGDVIDGLIGRAVRQAGSRAFPRDLRQAARRCGRGAAVRATENIIVAAEKRVREMRQGVEGVTEVIGDLPDTNEALSALRKIGGALRTVEGVLGKGKETQDEEKESQEQDEEQQVPVQGFRELDEEHVPRVRES